MRPIIYQVFIIFLLFLISLVSDAQPSLLNDEFNSPCNLADWQNITQVEGWMTPTGEPAEHLEDYNISLTYPGELYMMPYTSSWYANWRGVLLFKELSGDFVLTSRITVTRRNGTPNVPTSSFSLAGLMIRTPTGVFNPPGDTTGIQNYIFSSIGNALDNGQFQLEIKTTTNSSSDLDRPNIGNNNEIIMRVVRSGSAIIVLSSFDNTNWVVRNRYLRTDFPDTLQLGFVTYTDWDNVLAVGYATQNVNILNDDFNAANQTSYNWNPDIIGRFGYVRFDSLQIPENFQGLDLASSDVNNNGISNQDLISFLGYSTEPTYPTGTNVWTGSLSNVWNEEDNWLNGVPTAGDHVVIPNCSCAEVFAPEIPISSPIFSSFHLEKGASATIPVFASLNVDLSAAEAFFVNEGEIDNHGTIRITNANGKLVKTVSALNNNSGANFFIEE